MKKTFLIFFIFIGQLFALDLNFNTFSSNFTQIVKSKNSTLSYSGHFILSKDQAYWSYDTPSKKEIYINKNQVTIVEHDLEQVIFSHLDNIPNLNEIFKKASLIDKDKLVAKYDIPCHRVIASNGIGGYNGGLEIKRFLLENEGVNLK